MRKFEEKTFFFDKKKRKNIRKNVIKKVYEDKEIILVNKIQNTILYVNKNYRNSMINIINKSYKNICFFDLQEQDILLNRIDKETSGLLLISKNKKSNLELYEQMIKKKIRKKYIALIYNTLMPRNGIIKTTVKKESNIKTKLAVTEYKTINIFNKDKISMIELTLVTGITHQIRIHMRYKNANIIGDLKYFNKYKNRSKYKVLENLRIHNFQALHAYKISFFHPISLQLIKFTIPINIEMKKVISLLNIEK